ncbi:MAG: SgcJ/EcaC family oxidoreductase [Devosiaceae bacterium]|nr:SgcJ/EcaC family oxidoreductase [Devosiaceae bacterium MH13]
MSEHETGEAVARAFFDAWNAGDADAIAALFVDDADFVNVVGFWWRTAKQIRKAHDYGFRHIFGGAQVEITELKVRALTADLEIVHTVSTLDGQTAPDGGTAGRRIAVISMVTQRLGDGFKIISCQNTDRVEGADTHIAGEAGLRPVSYQ